MRLKPKYRQDHEIMNETNKEMINSFLAILNEALESDQREISKLIDYRVVVTDTLADHPDIPTLAGNKLGVLGLINGILKRLGETEFRIAASYEEDGEIIQKFAAVKS